MRATLVTCCADKCRGEQREKNKKRQSEEQDQLDDDCVLVVKRQMGRFVQLFDGLWRWLLISMLLL